MKFTHAFESAIADMELVKAAEAQSAVPVSDEFCDEVTGAVAEQESVRAIVREESLQEEIIEANQMCNDMETVQQHLGEVAVDGQISVESFLISRQLLRASKFGKRYAPAIGPSLEDISGSDVTVSTEALGDMLNAGLKAMSKMANRALDEFIRSLAFVGTRTSVNSSKAKKVIAEANKAKGDVPKGTVLKIRGNSFLTRNGEKMSADAQVKYLIESYGIFSYLTTTYIDAVISAFRSNANLADTINTASDDAFKKSFEKFVAGFRDPRDKLPFNGNTHILPGRTRFFEDGKSAYSGNDPTLKKLDAIATKRQPKSVLESTRENTSIFEKGPELEAFNKAQVLELAKAVVKFGDSVDKGAVAMRSLLATFRTGALFIPGGGPVRESLRLFSFLFSNGLIYALRALPVAAIPGGRKYPTEYRLLKKALSAQSASLKNVYFDITMLGGSTSTSVIRQCEKSLKTISDK